MRCVRYYLQKPLPFRSVLPLRMQQLRGVAFGKTISMPQDRQERLSPG